MPKQRVTMADVAREAGVSLMTVSRAINGKEGLSEATRDRIQAIVDRLGYRPSVIARSLVTDRTATIGLVVIDNSNPFFSEVARGVEHEAYAQGYNVFLCNTEEDIEREQAVLRSLEEKRVDGVILCSPRSDEKVLRAALEQHAAVVLINRRLADMRLGTVLVNDEEGGRICTEHLLNRGHRAIGFLSGPSRSYSGQARARGYRATLEAAGVTPCPDWTRPCLPVVESGCEATLALLTDQPQITALFCYNDLSAVGAMQACASLGRRVPDDLAIVGFDDIPLARLVTPPLTTCHVPLHDLGKQATQLLLDHINGCGANCDDIVIEPKLFIRASAP
jgi:LacI family transcriptional regulator